VGKNGKFLKKDQHLMKPFALVGLTVRKKSMMKNRGSRNLHHADQKVSGQSEINCEWQIDKCGW